MSISTTGESLGLQPPLTITSSPEPFTAPLWTPE